MNWKTLRPNNLLEKNSKRWNSPFKNIISLRLFYPHHTYLLLYENFLKFQILFLLGRRSLGDTLVDTKNAAQPVMVALRRRVGEEAAPPSVAAAAAAAATVVLGVVVIGAPHHRFPRLRGWTATTALAEGAVLLLATLLRALPRRTAKPGGDPDSIITRLANADRQRAAGTRSFGVPHQNCGTNAGHW